MQQLHVTPSVLFTGEQCTAAQRTVLVIEPNPAIRGLLDDVLQLSEYKSISLPSVDAVWPWIASGVRRPFIPLLILLDLSYPVSRGEQEIYTRFCGEWLEHFLPIPPIVVLTTQLHLDEILCVPVLIKPFHIRDILHILQRYPSDILLCDPHGDDQHEHPRCCTIPVVKGGKV